MNSSWHYLLTVTRISLVQSEVDISSVSQNFNKRAFIYFHHQDSATLDSQNTSGKKKSVEVTGINKPEHHQ